MQCQLPLRRNVNLYLKENAKPIRYLSNTDILNLNCRVRIIVALTMFRSTDPDACIDIGKRTIPVPDPDPEPEPELKPSTKHPIQRLYESRFVRFCHVREIFHSIYGYLEVPDMSNILSALYIDKKHARMFIEALENLVIKETEPLMEMIDLCPDQFLIEIIGSYHCHARDQVAMELRSRVVEKCNQVMGNNMVLYLHKNNEELELAETIPLVDLHPFNSPFISPFNSPFNPPFTTDHLSFPRLRMRIRLHAR